jgi:hypothetical protein
MDARESGEFLDPIFVAAVCGAGDFSGGRDRIEDDACVKETADVAEIGV